MSKGNKVLPIAVFCYSVLLGGCVNLLPEPSSPPPRVITLAPAWCAPEDAKRAAKRVYALSDINAEGILKTNLVPVLTCTPAGACTEDKVAGLLFNAAIPVLIRNAMQDRLGQNRQIVAGKKSGTFLADTILEGDLRKFHMVLADRPYVAMTLHLRWINARTRKIEQHRSFEAQVPLRSKSALDIGAAFNALLEQAFKTL